MISSAGVDSPNNISLHNRTCERRNDKEPLNLDWTTITEYSLIDVNTRFEVISQENIDM